MPQKILITGGAGFIGANLVSQLRKIGIEEYVFDNLSSLKSIYRNNIFLLQASLKFHAIASRKPFNRFF